MTLNDIKEIVANITYKDWEFHVDGTTEHPYLQIRFVSKDNSDIHSEPELQLCRKWQLSQFMIKSEIIRTAWKAVLAAEEHEAAEQFKYKNVDLFNPHIDLEELAMQVRYGKLPKVRRPVHKITVV